MPMISIPCLYLCINMLLFGEGVVMMLRADGPKGAVYGYATCLFSSSGIAFNLLELIWSGRLF